MTASLQGTLPFLPRPMYFLNCTWADGGTVTLYGFTTDELRPIMDNLGMIATALYHEKAFSCIQLCMIDSEGNPPHIMVEWK